MSYYSELEKTYIIAEIGVNHNGDIDLAKVMIDAAINSRADAVKFQTFTAKKLVTINTPKVQYQRSTTSNNESHYQMLEKLELSLDGHRVLKKYCDECNIDFLSTPYDLDSVDFLEDLEVSQYKIASADIVDLPLLKRVALTHKPTILSVGMATMNEIKEALDVFRECENENLVLLHCVSNYPCSFESINLRVLQTLEQAFKVPVGYSDHSVGHQAAVLSIGFNAKVIEKHFTTDKNLPGPDHKASSTPKEFRQMVSAVRNSEIILGSPIKSCQKEEFQMSQVSRKSITLGRDMKQGEMISLSDLAMKRPGTSLPAREIKNIIGRTIRKDLYENHQLEWNDLNE